MFEYEAYENYGLDAESGLLWQMMCFTGEQFTPEQLQASRLASVYFDETCKFAFSVIRLTSSPQIRPPGDLKSTSGTRFRSLRNFKVLTEEDVFATAAFMPRCLHLNPKDRPTAEELLRDPWWQVVV